MSSFRSINYRLRVGKSIERKMMVEAWSRLSAIRPLSDYQYIGFGSTSFIDFVLVHKQLGIHRLISIERVQNARDRVEFNRPFNCVMIEMGDSSAVLPRLDLSKPSIIWLDYDLPMTSDVISDLEGVVLRAAPSTVVCVSVNVHPFATEKADPKIGEKRLADLIKRVGETRVPIDVNATALAGWGMSRVSYRILRGAVDAVVADRSHTEGTLQFHQWFHFEYEDGAKMLTMGGVLGRPETTAAFEKMGLDQLQFIRRSSDAYRIPVPQLTFREMRHIDRYLPNEADACVAEFLPPADVRSYAAVYRYFPLFAETDL